MRKSDEQVVVGYRIPRSVADWLREKAKREDRSQNWVLNRMLRQAMEAEVQEKAA
ncbi:hypothetical protein [Stenotrophomonas sp. GD03958]|uniref:hypothetical protein n=1 Tax=Stenotrophomonas sp. GD03958 TaxID=2975411 RepID=UPI00244A2845|nr:hypothetical protein [Stenotrophomonas sp. GD03958]MDH1192535.1 hypothetical protein [Stenotrophomonas sp. GD03958]